MDQFRVGKAVIHRIEEWRGNFMTPQSLFVGFDAADYAATKALVSGPYLEPDSDTIVARLQSWVIEVDGLKILIDTGAGNDKQRPGIPLFGNLRTPFLQTLAAAGFSPQDFDFVICTHLHVDHVGWNTQLLDGCWLPTFPRARYVFPRVDAEFWDPRNIDAFPPKVGEAVNAGFYADSVQPILDAQMAWLIEGSTRISDSVQVDPAPGHTPGSQTITVSSDGETAIFVGDVVHHPLQIMNPAWNSIFCEDAVQARASRLQVLRRVVASRAIMIPAHFAGEHAVRVIAKSGGMIPAAI